MKQSSVNQKIDDIFKEVGEFGPYQLLLFSLVGITAFIPAIVGYSYSFYAVIPDYRCKIPNLENDTFELMGEWHKNLIEKYVPITNDNSYKNVYDKCNLKVYNESKNLDFAISLNHENSTKTNDQINDNQNYKLVKCEHWVYSKKYFESSLLVEWNMVCDKTARKTLFSTLYFIGTYGVLLNGFLSDKFGRKNAAYMFIVANALLNIGLTILISTKDIDINTQQIIFAVLRLFTGIASNVYAVAVVLAIEICGPSKRVMAANIIYYFYIIGELIVVLFAYFIKNFSQLYTAYTALMVSFVFYFWIVPESPRWLMTKNKVNKAYTIFKRIAISNKRSFEELTELQSLNKLSFEKANEKSDVINSSNLLIVNSDKEEMKSELEKIETNVEIKQPTFSLIQTIKVFFKSKKLMIRTSVTLLNWLTNTLVYYGISFNTNDLFGDPFLNFTLSVIVELIAIITCQLTLERFGRKIPYAVNMAITGISLMMIQFCPNDKPYFVTLLALIGKFSISFTYNSIYIITAEIHPTVIRNSAVSLCQTFARMGALIAPNIQLLGELYWYPIPFIIFGSFSILSAISFIVFMPETKDKKLPDTIEEFVQ